MAISQELRMQKEHDLTVDPSLRPSSVTEAGQMVRGDDGQFIQGVSGNKLGRPKGSKNKVTLYKLQAEEAFRARNQDRIDLVLDMIVCAAIDGDKAAQKLVWDSTVSKSNIAEDKNVGAKQAITVHRMTVMQKDNDNESSDSSQEDNDNESESS